jgi:hypothetical protein
VSLPAKPTVTFVMMTCVVALLTACGAAASTTREASFCDSMERATALLQPTAVGETRETTRVRYVELASVLDAARRQAPTPIASDVTAFAGAVEEFALALAGVDYDLDELFRTTGGVQLAERTSHALTPATIQHLTRACGLTLG